MKKEHFLIEINKFDSDVTPLMTYHETYAAIKKEASRMFLADEEIERLDIYRLDVAMTMKRGRKIKKIT